MLKLILILTAIAVICILVILAGFWASLFLILFGAVVFAFIFFLLNKIFGNKNEVVD